jgi:hypothetical protein
VGTSDKNSDILIDNGIRKIYTLLQKVSTPSEYSVLDNGCTHQMALKKNSVRRGVLLCVSVLEKTSVAIIGKIADEPTREHGGIQYIGQVHQIEIMMLGFVLKFSLCRILDCMLFTNQEKKTLQAWSIS